MGDSILPVHGVVDLPPGSTYDMIWPAGCFSVLLSAPDAMPPAYEGGNKRRPLAAVARPSICHHLGRSERILTIAVLSFTAVADPLRARGRR
jgi:hypothetical protein